MPKGATGNSDGSSFLSSTILTCWIVNVPFMRTSLLHERAQHRAGVLRLRLLSDALLSTQARPNVEIIKPNMYVYVVVIHTGACC